MRGAGLSQGCNKNAQRYICRHSMPGNGQKSVGVRSYVRPRVH